MINEPFMLCNDINKEFQINKIFLEQLTYKLESFRIESYLQQLLYLWVHFTSFKLMIILPNFIFIHMYAYIEIFPINKKIRFMSYLIIILRKKRSNI